MSDRTSWVPGGTLFGQTVPGSLPNPPPFRFSGSSSKPTGMIDSKGLDRLMSASYSLPDPFPGESEKRIAPQLEATRFKSFTSMLESGEYSDLVITSNWKSYKVHRAIVCSQSEVFKRMLKPGFKEAETGVITLPEDDPGAVHSMISYFYRMGYYYILAPEPEMCLKHAKVYTLADRYEIPGLKNLALMRFRDTARRRDGLWDLETMRALACEAYQGTMASDRGLRRAVTEVFVRNRSLLSDPKWKPHAHDMGELMHDVLLWVMGTYKEEGVPPDYIWTGPYSRAN